MAAKRPFFVIVPGASHNASHYGLLSHLLLKAGYPVFSATLPSVGAAGKITAEDDGKYVRDRMILPVLDHEEHDVILLSHSYSGVPASAAGSGLSKAERTAAGKKTGILGQIFLAAILTKGGDGNDIVTAFGGNYPPHIRPEPETNLLRCDDRIPPLLQDVPPELADVCAVSAMAQGMTSFTSPCPRASWDDEAYKGKVAYIRTTNDACIPFPVQQMMLDGSGVDFIVKDIESGHSAQVAQPEKLTQILLDLAKGFEGLEGEEN
ncbi:alpha/beta-hydrolase [Polyplosphaeria fusca]|uniref:Alpha/beta-hydrolase n=1 Tax=Polyplosphaeria fusca TaxID=682080 RepID=A0A9P4R884_9PLEO|nr:alpha/beta-hydrolase [Polyplosphaeria fusca]